MKTRGFALVPRTRLAFSVLNFFVSLELLLFWLFCRFVLLRRRSEGEGRTFTSLIIVDRPQLHHGKDTFQPHCHHRSSLLLHPAKLTHELCAAAAALVVTSIEAIGTPWAALAAKPSFFLFFHNGNHSQAAMVACFLSKSRRNQNERNPKQQQHSAPKSLHLELVFLFSFSWMVEFFPFWRCCSVLFGVSLCQSHWRNTDLREFFNDVGLSVRSLSLSLNGFLQNSRDSDHPWPFFFLPSNPFSRQYKCPFASSLHYIYISFFFSHSFRVSRSSLSSCPGPHSIARLAFVLPATGPATLIIRTRAVKMEMDWKWERGKLKKR